MPYVAHDVQEGSQGQVTTVVHYAKAFGDKNPLPIVIPNFTDINNGSQTNHVLVPLVDNKS